MMPLLMCGWQSRHEEWQFRIGGLGVQDAAASLAFGFVVSTLP
jgi:hypothetical protein